MNIKILSNTTINRIAAGEVVERPASAVKELVENAIDAGASSIDIIIENAGRNLITVIDNGSGMQRDDLMLAVERHATSKLREEDINQIEFFGFRGEALPSIASVSRMNITSKHKDEEFAWQLQINGGEKQELIPASLSVGTKVEVRDLFFATPARLKFLKTEKTEISYIVDTIYKIAMANPTVSFSLTSDGKDILSVKAEDQDLSTRLAALIGNNFSDNFAQIELNDPDCKISGFISLPTHNLGTSNEQYFFINKRPIKDKLLSVAVKIAYQDFIPNGRHPLVYLFLEMDPEFVDVNVHPAKAEVRFKDANLVRSAVISAIKQGIRNIGKTASSHLSHFALESFIPQTKPTAEFAEDLRPQYTSAPKTPHFTRPAAAIFEPIAPIVKADPQEFEANQQDFPLGSACGQIHDTYIIAQTRDGMILIDQHAAHERIFYEQLKEQINKTQVATQRLFIPEIIELPEHIIESLLTQNLERFGLYLEKFGANAIAVTEMPAILRCADVRKLILDIVDDLQEYQQQLSLESKINHILATFACHHSIRAGRNLSIKEMNALLREMEKCDHTGQCNHGRPTYISLNLKAIEKLFERT